MAVTSRALIKPAGVTVQVTDVDTLVTGGMRINASLRVLGPIISNLTFNDATNSFLTKNSIAGNANSIIILGSSSTTPVGIGGVVEVDAGNGGDADAVSPGGTGGKCASFGGVGGAASATQPAGKGGVYAATGGSGGSNALGGGGNDGGEVVFLGGPGTGNGNGGDFRADGGAKGPGAGANGRVKLGRDNASAVDIGSTNITTTVDGLLRNDNGRAVKRTPIADADYVVQTTDYLVAYTSLSNTRNVTLPIPAAGTAGQIFVVKDESGNAAALTPIVVTPGAGNIDGVASKSITTAFGRLMAYHNGTDYFVLVLQ